VSQLVRIERTVREKGQTTTHVQYAIASLPRVAANASRLLEFNRGHWGIENRLHWQRDTTYGEDGCRIKVGHGPQNMAAFRNTALNLLRLGGIKEATPALRQFAYAPRTLLKFLGILKQ
jgi:predicted transposase YbfD/YdcC